ncbi:MAG: ion transporter [Oxalobacteraceae bacterium]|jgi:voltage-gated potassium channel|nr:ion transporter [Oxalobacteraceae bacterium]
MKQTLMKILDGSSHDLYSKLAEWIITVVVLTNCAAVVFDSVPEIHSEYKDFFHELEFWSVMFFTAEYVLRSWSYGARYAPEEGGAWKGRREYMFSFFGLVDFFATAPFYVHFIFPYLDLRVLRVLRLLRILKLSKYNTALQDLFHAVASERKAFTSALFLLAIATVVSASMMYFAEGHNQPQHFGSIPACLYWSIITITSGYGNVEDLSLAGEIIALITGFLGVCMAAIMTGIVASAFSNQLSRKKAAFGQQLREALADGVVTEAEQEVLEKLRRQYRLSEEAVNSIMEDIRKEREAVGQST